MHVAIQRDFTHANKYTLSYTHVKMLSTPCYDYGMFEITILGEIPSKKNRQRISARGGIYKAKDAREFEAMVAKEVLVSRAKEITGPMSIKIQVYTKRQGDLDNQITSLLDALQYAGLYKNDREITEIHARKNMLGKGGLARAVVEITSWT